MNMAVVSTALLPLILLLPDEADGQLSTNSFVDRFEGLAIHLVSCVCELRYDRTSYGFFSFPYSARLACVS